MRTSIGGTAIMYIFIVFFILMAFLLTGTVIYYKGYKINSQIANSLEKFEGYNQFSAEDMDRVFKNLGYRYKNNSKCLNGTDGSCLAENGKHEFSLTCSHTEKNKGDNWEGNNYYITYKIKTYIYIDLPLNISMKIPITSRTNPIYQFTDYENGAC
mgnify:FL=1